ncbi:unnamed protein product, partial [Cladocopium goreaui]
MRSQADLAVTELVTASPLQRQALVVALQRLRRLSQRYNVLQLCVIRSTVLAQMSRSMRRSLWVPLLQSDAIFTSAVEYFTPEGFFIASEAVGLKAGSAHPQLSAHRAKFHSTLVAECCRLLGEDKVILNSRFVQLERHEDHVVLHFENSTTKNPMAPVTCHFVVGADGLKSRLRGALLGDGDPRPWPPWNSSI